MKDLVKAIERWNKSSWFHAACSAGGIESDWPEYGPEWHIKFKQAIKQEARQACKMASKALDHCQSGRQFNFVYKDYITLLDFIK